jgi:hypothetical protein
MVEPSKDPIPLNLAEAFAEAVSRFQLTWSPAEHGPEISIGRKPFSLKAVCSLVDSFEDKLPDDVFDVLDLCLDATQIRSKEDLGRNQTYAAGARCLRKLIEDRESEYRRLKELRRKR